MSFPDDLPYDWDWWLNEERRVTPKLAGILGRGANRFSTLSGVGRHLGVDVDPVRNEGFYVLERCVAPLEKLLEEDPGHWTTDYLAHRGDEVAREAVGDITSLDALAGALIQFGWGKTVYARNPKVLQAEDDLRQVLISQLAQRVYKMLDDWRRRDVWNVEVPKPGLVRASTHRIKDHPKAS